MLNIKSLSVNTIFSIILAISFGQSTVKDKYGFVWEVSNDAIVDDSSKVELNNFDFGYIPKIDWKSFTKEEAFFLNFFDIKIKRRKSDGNTSKTVINGKGGNNYLFVLEFEDTVDVINHYLSIVKKLNNSNKLVIDNKRALIYTADSMVNGIGTKFISKIFDYQVEVYVFIRFSELPLFGQ